MFVMCRLFQNKMFCYLFAGVESNSFSILEQGSKVFSKAEDIFSLFSELESVFFFHCFFEKFVQDFVE